MGDHKKMLWVRNFSKVALIRNPIFSDSYYEYEIASECPITGVCDYKDKGVIFLSFLTLNKDTEGLYHYLVRIKSIKEECKINNNASENGYAYKSLIDELMSLMSVFFRCRFYKIATYCILSDSNKIKTTHDIAYRLVNKNLNKHIFDENFPRNFGDFENFLNLVENLEPNIHLILIRSCDFYLTALREIGIHRDISYIRLVSAIECLLKYYDVKNLSFEEYCKKNNFTEEQKHFLKESLSLAKNGNIKSGVQNKFICFIREYSKYFFDKQNHGPLLYVIEDIFPEILKRIYNARSRYLHDGKPMYLNLEMYNNDKDWHFDASCGSIID